MPAPALLGMSVPAALRSALVSSLVVAISFFFVFGGALAVGAASVSTSAPVTSPRSSLAEIPPAPTTPSTIPSGRGLDGRGAFGPGLPGSTLWDAAPSSAGSLTVSLTESTLSLINNTLLRGNPATAHADGVTTIEYDPGIHDMIAEGVYSNALVEINASRNAMVGGFSAGSVLGSLAFEPGSDMLWVANPYSNSVVEVNGTTDTVVAQVSAGQGPAAVAYDAGDHRLFVADSGNYTNRGENVTVIDTQTDRVTSVLRVGTDPNALVYLPTVGQLYVSNFLSSNITVINASTLAIRATIPVGSQPLPVFYDSVNKDLYVPTTSGSNVTVVDPLSDTIVSAIALSGGYPAGLALNPSNDRLFVLGGTEVAVIDGTNQSVVAKVSVATLAAYGIVYDPVAGDVYVAAGTDNDVKVLDGTNGSVLATIPSYYTADGVAFDPESGDVYVADQGSSTISVINPSIRAAVATLDVAPNPFLSTGGPANGTVFVGAACSGGLAELNGTTGRIQSCLTIPGRVAGLTYDSQNGRLYVSDGNSNVSVVDPTTGAVLDRIDEGNRPYWAGPWVMALDPNNDTLFVPNYDWGNVSVVNLATDTIVRTIPAGPQPEVATYDPVDGSMWVSEFNSPGSIDRFNATTYASLPRISVPSYPEGLLYDPNSREVYVADSGAAEVSVLDAANGSLVATIPVGTNDYSLGLDPSADVILCANAGSNNVTLIDGTTHTVLGFVPTGLWPRDVAFASGEDLAILPDQDSGSVTELKIHAEFTPSAYPVTFSESGLTPGRSWSVALGGLSRSSTTSSLAFEEGNGTYPFSVAPVGDLAALPGEGEVVVNGSSVSTSVAFSLTSYSIDFSETGLPLGTTWSVTLDGVLRSSPNSSVTFQLGNGTYSFSIAAVGGRIASPSSGTISVSGYSVAEPVAFSTPTYRLTFTETGLPGGTPWAVTLAGQAQNSTTESDVFAEPNGTYAFEVSSHRGYDTSPASGSLTVAGGSVSQPIQFRALYRIVFDEEGLPLGMGWSVTLNGTSNASRGSTVGFLVDNGTYPYSVSAPTGYDPSPSSGALTLAGASRTITVIFSPGPSGSSSGRPGFLGLPPYLGYGVVAIALFVIVVTGAVLVRRRDGRTKPPPTQRTSASPGTGTGAGPPPTDEPGSS